MFFLDGIIVHETKLILIYKPIRNEGTDKFSNSKF